MKATTRKMNREEVKKQYEIEGLDVEYKAVKRRYKQNQKMKKKKDK